MKDIAFRSNAGSTAIGDAVGLRRLGTLISASLIGAVTLAPHPEFALPVTDHLVEAQELVAALDSIGWPTEASRNRYCGSGCTGATVTWGTPGTPTSYSNESQCAPFVPQLLVHTYTWATSSYFRSECGSTSPNSARYYDRINADTADHMGKISKVTGLAAGDILAIKYEAGASGGTGHTAVVRSRRLAQCGFHGVQRRRAQVHGAVCRHEWKLPRIPLGN
ncbi:hypothetical protein ABZZ20_24660 [Streptomyces sp. NPDC006430]|uniref:hypothetical protein n=1 Tax=Streptomyces sp. NPDC006430 TaxID=3154299 RepID=UPI0033B11448